MNAPNLNPPNFSQQDLSDFVNGVAYYEIFKESLEVLALLSVIFWPMVIAAFLRNIWIELAKGNRS